MGYHNKAWLLLRLGEASIDRVIVVVRSINFSIHITLQLPSKQLFQFCKNSKQCEIIIGFSLAEFIGRLSSSILQFCGRRNRLFLIHSPLPPPNLTA